MASFTIEKQGLMIVISAIGGASLLFPSYFVRPYLPTTRAAYDLVPAKDERCTKKSSFSP